MAQLSYCAQQVRTFDRDRFLCALFAPAERREDLFAVLALDVELRRIAGVVSEPLVGQMRMQWWREAVAGAFAGDAPAHPVVEALAAVARRGLGRRRVEGLIEAHAHELEAEPPVSVAALVDRVHATAGFLTALSLDVLGATDEPSGVAGRHVAVAWALIGELRAMAAAARGGRGRPPLDLGREAPVPDRAAAVKDVVGHAAAHLAEARARPGRVPRAALAALLPATLADGWLARIEAAA